MSLDKPSPSAQQRTIISFIAGVYSLNPNGRASAEARYLRGNTWTGPWIKARDYSGAMLYFAVYDQDLFMQLLKIGITDSEEQLLNLSEALSNPEVSFELTQAVQHLIELGALVEIHQNRQFIPPAIEP